MAKKLPEGIRLLESGRYQARYPVTVNGKTVQKSAGTFAKLQDAKDARSLALAERRQGTWVDPRGPRMEFSAWVDEWLELRSAPLTASRRSFLKVHVLAEYGEQRLGEITPMQVQHWVNALSAKGLAPTTVNEVYRLFKQIMASAVDYDVLVKSPCRRVKLPTNASSAPTPIHLEDMRRLEAAAPPRFRAMIHLSAWAGLRWQEAAALRWSNVDLAAGTLTVTEAVKESGKVGTTKNRKTRLVHIAPATVEVLTAHRRDYGTTDLLFANRFGRLLDYASFRRNVWLPLVAKCDLDPAPTYHDLRHGYAAHMVEAGLDPRALSEAMGHHSASFTMMKYGWATKNAGKAVRKAAAAAMSRDVAGPVAGEGEPAGQGPVPL